MFAMPRLPASVGCVAALISVSTAPTPVVAAEWQRNYLEPAIQAWMGVVTMLAEDGEREKNAPDRGDRRRGRAMHGDRHGHHGPHHGRMHPHHARMGPPRPEGPRADAISMLHEIAGRLARIERMLAGRGPGGPPAGGPGRGEWRGAGRPEMSSEAREMMEARRARMKQARDKWEQASPEEREKMKQQWQARMQEGREQMQWARQRFQDMEARIKQLEAEVARLKQAAEKDD
jgi:hypothetical protein